MVLLQQTGTVVYIGAQEIETKFGIGEDEIDAEIIFSVTDSPHTFGFNLRNDNKNFTVNQDMFELLKYAFETKTPVVVDYDIGDENSDNNKTNAMIKRIWISQVPEAVHHYHGGGG
jgi:hypothetical protein